MITRPLDLASRLRPPPRNFDAWFYVNAGLLVLFFYWFGSRFILAPGLGVNFQLPRIAGARAGAAPATHHITVLGMITTFLAFQRDYPFPSDLAHGMWQALLCFAAGLMLAIPAHLAHHFLASRVRAIVRDMEWAGNEIMKYLLTDYRERGQP